MPLVSPQPIYYSPVLPWGFTIRVAWRSCWLRWGRVGDNFYPSMRGCKQTTNLGWADPLLVGTAALLKVEVATVCLRRWQSPLRTPYSWGLLLDFQGSYQEDALLIQPFSQHLPKWSLIKSPVLMDSVVKPGDKVLYCGQKKWKRGMSREETLEITA